VDYRKFGTKTWNDLVSRGLPAGATTEEAEAWVKENIPGLDRVMRFMEIVYSESDRGCVICASAIIDDALEAMIRQLLKRISNPSTHLVNAVLKTPPEPASDSLLDSLLTRRPMPPLGSFAVRIKMARALGLIHDSLMNALDAMREMRNDASHLANPFSFENPRYKIQSLFGPLSHKEQIFLGAHNIVRQEDPQKAMSMRQIFQQAAASIYYRINDILERPDWGALILAGKGGPFDAHYDDLMGHSSSASGSSEDNASSAQT
jgi:DNA-binding MltR family transcriptional regulator